MAAMRILLLCGALVGVNALLMPQAGVRAPAGAVRTIRMQAPEMSEMELAEQSGKLDALAAKWRKRQQIAEYEDSSRIGWVAASEVVNGRFAMFFLIVGLITEYYTGESVPQQVYTLFQTLGVVD